MEILVIVAVVYYVIKTLSKASQQQGQKNTQAAKPSQQHARTEPRNRPQAAAPQPSSLNMSRYETTPRIGYQTITHRMENLSSRQAYQGSMGGSSAEGVDLCDSSLGHDRTAVRTEKIPSVKEIPASLKLDMDAQGLLQGIVMSEILARPTQRKWGKH